MQNLNIEAKMEGGKGKVRKRRCSSSSSSSPSSLMAQNYRLKRTFLMGKRRGSSTPVPTWKMITPQSQSPQNYGKDFSLSARKLAALLWEIDGMPSPTVKMAAKERILESSKLRSTELGLSDPVLTTVSEGILDPTKLCSCRRRALMAGCKKLLRANTNLRSSTSIPSCLGQVDEKQSHGYGQTNVVKSSLKDVYNGLATSKQLLNVLSLVGGLEQLECISSTLVSALRVELDQSCNRVSKLIQGEKTEKSEIDILLKGIKHSSIHNAAPSIVGELEAEKKLRRKSEKLNKKAGAELAETKASLTRAIKELESEKKARRKVEQVCEELARGVWELKRQFAKVREEVEKEQEMFHLADLLREERVQMKLSDAKCLYEEKNALVDKLRNEVEAYLKGEKGGGGSSGHDKRKELEKLLRETFTGSQQNQDKESKNNAAVNEDEEEESDDSDLHSIEFSMEDISKSFLWGDGVENGSKGNSVDTSKGRIPKKQAFTQNRKLQMTLVSECSTN